MTEINEVTLEFLRHGRPHNHLLSPLTRYMALCGRHEAAPVTLPFEHWEIMELIDTLRYKHRSHARSSRLARHHNMANALGRFLFDVPGFAVDVMQRASGSDQLCHLQLVFSASELCLLPFEVAKIPDGYSGNGQELLLRVDPRVVLTRQARDAKGYLVPWDRPPKILFAWAATRENMPVPYEAHLLALRRALDNFIFRSSPDRSPIELSDYLMVLPDASLSEIHDTMSRHAITHVHLLAHGMRDKTLVERHGLLLWDKEKQDEDLVDGERLGSALLAGRSHNRGEAPVVVTIASCDNGHQGSVIMPGSNLLHSIHEQGIPLVVGSQFPLSLAGSVRFVDSFYRALLDGQDPRLALCQLRFALRNSDTDVHDWASLVSYASLPYDLNRQLQRFRARQAKEIMRVSLAFAHKVTDKRIFEEPQNEEALLEKVKRRVEKAILWMPAAQPANDETFFSERSRRESDLCTLGSAQKRIAQTFYLQAEAWREAQIRNEGPMSEPSTDVLSLREESRIALRKALAYYQRALGIHPESAWAGTQCLSLNLYLTYEVQGRLTHNGLCPRQWRTYHRLALAALESDHEETRLWSCCNLAELEILGLIGRRGGMQTFTETIDEGLDPVHHLRTLQQQAFNSSRHVIACYWQLMRYARWFVYRTPEADGQFGDNLVESELTEIQEMFSYVAQLIDIDRPSTPENF